MAERRKDGGIEVEMVSEGRGTGKRQEKGLGREGGWAPPLGLVGRDDDLQEREKKERNISLASISYPAGIA